MKNKIYGVGINDYAKKIWVGGKHIKSYNVWIDMLRRCFDVKFQNSYPTYIGCSVCDEWHSFKNFKEWFDKNYRWDLDDIGIKLELDKDLLSGESKVYSPDTCVFLPNKVNTFLINKQSNNTSGYTGVSWHKNTSKWRANIGEFNNGKRKHLGLFKNIEDARDAYNKAREIECIKVKEYLRELGYNEDIINKIK